MSKGNKNSRSTRPRAADRAITLKQNENIDNILDSAMTDLFYSIAGELGRPYVNKIKDIPRLRRIISSWAPTEYSGHEDPATFHANYALSQFFDRWISTTEELGQVDLEFDSALDFLETNHEGYAFDEYGLSDPALKPLFDRMGYIIGETLDTFSLAEIYAACEHGPNSTTTVKYSDSYLDVKDFDMSGTSASLQQFICYLNDYNTSLKEALMNESDELRSCINAYHLDGLPVGDCTNTAYVPKNYKKLRSMCPEMTIPAFFGSGTGKVMAKRLRKIGIDLKTQPQVHKDLARISSLEEVFIGTVDWSGASNRIWIALCSAVMVSGAAPKWLDWIMNVCRSTQTSLNFKVKVGPAGKFQTLDELYATLRKYGAEVQSVSKGKRVGQDVVHRVTCIVHTTMIGTMGNAVTFPLQTLLFYAFLTACTELAEQRVWKESGTDSPPEFNYVSSFGDDGLVDSRAMDEVIYFSSLIGWKLNIDKTHTTGRFRESCGGDYYMGRNVRALRPQRPPLPQGSTLNDKNATRIAQAFLYICSNAAIEMLDAFGLPPYAIDRWLEKYHQTLKVGRICVVPPHFPEGSGLRVCDDISPTLFPEDVFRYGRHAFAGVGLDPNIFHVPVYNVDSSVSFRCLSVRKCDHLPRYEYNFYARSLKRMVSPTLEADVDWTHRSFFSLDLESISRLDSRGFLAKKVCVINKAVSSTPVWGARTTTL